MEKCRVCLVEPNVVNDRYCMRCAREYVVPLLRLNLHTETACSVRAASLAAKKKHRSNMVAIAGKLVGLYAGGIR